MRATDRVLGVDGCATGWVGIALGTGKPRAYLAASITELVEQAGAHDALSVVAIDIPIGLPDAGRRVADVLARHVIGARRSSVFMTPVRPALEAPDHPTAVAINRELAGEGVSRQAYGLRKRIFEVEAFARTTGLAVVEVHPEVSFARMLGEPLEARKTTWAGVELRRRLLADDDIPLSGDVGRPGLDAAVDDVLDAGAAAWTARRVADGRAGSMPDPPEVFSDGWPTAIWA
jgi:predicted RNase H-like nuclease